MKGRIKRFFSDRGYGFIIGEDGTDYFFHISQVKDIVEFKNWMRVKFDVATGKRGKIAVDIRSVEQNNSPSKFITCGNKNIRLSNIKEYGINRYIGHIENYGFSNHITTISENEYKRYKDYYDSFAGKSIVNEYYLYIKTYQNEYMKFSQKLVDFDIFKKYDEICNAMK